MISNILEQEDVVKGLPDEALQKEARAPSGMLQQFLVVSEIKRRTDMRKSHENQMKEQPQGTVADQIVMEGIAGMMPQQGVGMPPQMGPQMPPQGMPPQGMPPQMPPPGMPPMGMASGGIVRMQNMGQVPSNNRVGTLKEILESNPSISFIDLVGMGFTQDDLERLRTMGYRERLASERVLSDAIAGLEKVDPPMRLSKTMPLPEVKPASEIYSQSGVTDFAGDVSRAMQTPIATAGDRATLEKIRSGLSPSISSSDIDAGIAGMVSERAPSSALPKYSIGSSGVGIGSIMGLPTYSVYDPDSPSAVFSESAGELMQGSLDEAAGRRQAISDFFSGKYRYKPESIALLEAEEAGDISRAERKLAMAGDSVGGLEDSVGGAEVQGTGSNVQSTGRSAPDILGLGSYQDDLLGYKGGFPYRPGRTADDLDSIRSLIAENDARSEELFGRSEVDASKPGTEPAEPVASLLDAVADSQTDKSDPSNRRTALDLDFSDIIADSKRMAQANALIQLGAGIAAGDTAKALSAAGTAATKGMQDARMLDIRKRLAEYQAGREDQQREYKADEFDRQMKLLEKKVDNAAEYGGAARDAALIRALSDDIEYQQDQLKLHPGRRAQATEEEQADLRVKLNQIEAMRQKMFQIGGLGNMSGLAPVDFMSLPRVGSGAGG